MDPQTNEPGPADGQRKVEAQVHDDLDKSYQEMLKKEQDRFESELTAKKTYEFDNVRKLGFVTQKDVEKQMQGIFGKFLEQQKANDEKIQKLTEWVMRAKSQGFNTGVTDDKPVVDDPMKKWKPQW